MAEGKVHIPRAPCPHIAAEFFENGQADLGDEMLRPLHPRAIYSAQMSGRRGRFHNEPVRTKADVERSGQSTSAKAKAVMRAHG